MERLEAVVRLRQPMAACRLMASAPTDPKSRTRMRSKPSTQTFPTLIGGRPSSGQICHMLTRTEGMVANMSDPLESTSLQRAGAVLAEGWQRAWNSHDMQGAGELLAPDADFVNVGGRWLRGRSQFIDYHVRLHEMQMRNSTWSNLALTVRALSDEVAVAHLEWRIEGDRDPDGGRREPRQGLFTWVLAMERDVALIAAAHNTNVVAAPTGHRPTPPQGS
jgi:uncharacterized protein (TIGR02246 family)